MPGSENLSERAHALLKREILSAALLPGERLRLDTLAARYGIGVVPIREALNGLVSEGLVERRYQRGFAVAGMSRTALEELVKTRIWLETKALSESLAAADEAWEEGVIIAFHRLERTQRLIGSDGELVLNPRWEELHKDFHMKLIGRCGSSWLLGFCSSMMDQAVRYRSLSINFAVKRRGDAVQEHRELLDAALDHDIARATRLLEEHYSRTFEELPPLPD